MDSALRRALNEKTAESTVLIVTQRVATVKNADQIIVLEEGEVDAGIEEMAGQTGQPVEVLRTVLSRGGMAKFEAKLLEDKIVAWLLEQAETVEGED